jgi:glutamate 5-kinase
VDDGAREALRHSGKSLLPPGVVQCEGDFVAGDVVRLCDLDGTEFARGIAKFSAGEIRSQLQARAPAASQKTLVRVAHEELVHRDDLVIL